MRRSLSGSCTRIEEVGYHLAAPKQITWFIEERKTQTMIGKPHSYHCVSGSVFYVKLKNGIYCWIISKNWERRENGSCIFLLKIRWKWYYTRPPENRVPKMRFSLSKPYVILTSLFKSELKRERENKAKLDTGADKSSSEPSWKNPLNL